MWKYWNEYILENDYSPGHTEAAKEFKITVQTVHTLLLRMQKKGWMTRLNKTKRNWIPTTPKKDFQREKYLESLRVQFDKLHAKKNEESTNHSTTEGRIAGKRKIKR